MCSTGMGEKWRQRLCELSLRSPPSWYPKDTPPPEQREREKDRVDALFNMTGKIKIIVGNELEFWKKKKMFLRGTKIPTSSKYTQQHPNN